MALRFAEFVFDEGRRQLFRGREPLHLEPKAFELLALLLSRRPNAVSKPEIRQAVWAGTCVSGSSLPGIVGDLRAALGDHWAEPKLIRTVRGYGYAFCGTALGDSGPTSEACQWTALQAGHEIPLPDGIHWIGRDEKCRIRFASARISRSHARIQVEGDRAFIQDLGSGNGTLLRGERIQGASEIQPGDTVCVGREVIQFLTSGHTALTTAD